MPFLFEFHDLLCGITTPAGATFPVSDEHTENLDRIYQHLYDNFPTLPPLHTEEAKPCIEALLGVIPTVFSDDDGRITDNRSLGVTLEKLTTVPPVYPLAAFPIIFFDFILRTFGENAVLGGGRKILQRDGPLYTAVHVIVASQQGEMK